jgi:hypothetical protein
VTTMDNRVRNGVDTATLSATIDAVKGDNDIAKFQFRATNTWVSGTHNQSTIHGFYGANGPSADVLSPEPTPRSVRYSYSSAPRWLTKSTPSPPLTRSP